MEDIHELLELCNIGKPIILSADWEKYNEARVVLTSNGYREEPSLDEDENQDKSSILFVTRHAAAIEQPAEATAANVFSFPNKAEAPQYIRQPPRRTSAEWNMCTAFQLDTIKINPPEPPTIQAEIPNVLEKQQRLAIQFVVQPYLKLDNAHLHVKIHVDKLVIGVNKEDLLLEDHHCGYYPYFVRVMIEPILELNEACVVVYKRNDEDVESLPSAVLKDTRKFGGNLGLGLKPITLALNYEVTKEREASTKAKHCLVPVDVTDNGSLASFEWCIVRWDNKKRYSPGAPHSRFRWSGPLKLPFEPGATAANIKAFPDALWKFPRHTEISKLKFRVTLQVEMHLLWYLGKSSFWKSPDSRASAFQHMNEYGLFT